MTRRGTRFHLMSAAFRTSLLVGLLPPFLAVASGQETGVDQAVRTVIQGGRIHWGSMDPTTDYAISSRSELLATQGTGSLHLIKLETGAVLKTFFGVDGRVVAFSPGDRFLAFSDRSFSQRPVVEIYDVERDLMVSTLNFEAVEDALTAAGSSVSRTGIDFIKFSATGGLLFSSGFGSSIQEWDTASGELNSQHCCSRTYSGIPSARPSVCLLSWRHDHAPQHRQ